MKNHKIGILVFIFVLLLSGCATTTATDDIQTKNLRAFEQIDFHYEANNYNESTKLLNDLSQSPDLNNLELAYIANYRGNICYANNDIDCAIEEFSKIENKADDVPTSFYNQIIFNLSNIHYSQGNYSEAKRLTEQFLATVPNSKYLTLGAINIQLGKIYDAEADPVMAKEKYRQALAYGNQNIKNKTGYSTLEDGAKKIYFIDTSSVNLIISANKGLNKLDDAISFVNSLSDIQPKIEHKIRIADYYQELGNMEEAESLRRELIESKQAGYKDGKLIVWNTDGEILPKFRANPRYPRRAAERGLEGWVDLKMDVDEQGKTSNIRVTDSNAENIFGASAIKAASQYLYEPFIKDGEISELKDVEIRIAFELQR